LNDLRSASSGHWICPLPNHGQEALCATMENGWRAALAPVAHQIAAMGEFLRAEVAAGRDFLPHREHILRAFTQPFSDVRVLIVGQDPYPTSGHPTGLAFAVGRHVRPLPPSLSNLYRELRADVGITPPEHGDLSSWTRRGVLLLNRCLTLRPGAPGSHRGAGWEQVTDQVARALTARRAPLVAILWGQDARSLRPLLPGVPVIESPHPSAATAGDGFFGSRPFSRANGCLRRQAAAPVDWMPD
jgi:uracil-DNA glycosylase